MKFAIYTKGERGATCLSALIKNGLCPILCVSENDDSVIKVLCNKYKIPYITESNPKKTDHIQSIHCYKPDLLVCAGYSKILPLELFSELPLGGINCHGGKLPEYRGASPIPWQIINGEKEGAAYILKLTEGIDDGPILAKGKYIISMSDTARDVTDKVLDIFERILPEVVKMFSEGSVPKGVRQKEKNACHWTRRYPEDGLINWHRLTAEQVVNLVRALDSPYPGAFLIRETKKIIIRKAGIYNRKMAGVPSRLVGKGDNGALILARDGAVEILEFIVDGNIYEGKAFPGKYGETYS